MNLDASAPQHVARAASPSLVRTDRDRRRHARVGARGVASHIQTRDGSTPGLTVENISLGGLFVRSTSVLAVGTEVMLQLVRPGLKRAIQVTGRVVSVVSAADARARGSVAGMGIHLQGVDAESRERLAVLIDDLAAVATTITPANGLPAVLAPIASPVVASPVVASPVVTPAVVAPAPRSGDDPAMALATEMIASQNERIYQLLAEVQELRRELLRRNRTIGDLANKLAARGAV